MPMPATLLDPGLFAPVIGRDLADLSARGTDQERFWSGFINRKQSEDLARRAQGEQAQNEWLYRVAQLQQQNAARQQQAAEQQAQMEQRAGEIGQSQAVEAAQRLSEHLGRAQEAAEKKREFDVSAELSKLQYGVKEKEKQDALNVIDHYAAKAQPDVDEAGRGYQSALEEATKAQQKLETEGRQLHAQMAPEAAAQLTFDRSGYFIPVSKLLPLRAEGIKANDELAKTRAAYDEAKAQLSVANSEWTERRKETVANGLQIVRQQDSEGNPYFALYSPHLNKHYGLKAKRTKEVAPPETPTEVAPEPTELFRRLTTMPQPSPDLYGGAGFQPATTFWPGMAAANAPQTVPPTSAAQPLPLPKSRADLVVGQPYLLASGVWIWNGQHFVKR